MQAWQIMILFAATTLAASAACVWGLQRGRASRWVGLVAAVAIAGLFCLAARWFATASISDYVWEVVLALVLATTLPALVAVDRWALADGRTARVTGWSLGVGLTVWIVLALVLGVFVGCELDTRCY